MNNRIIAVHLLNDRSGSPMVFRQALEVLRHSHPIVLYTATPGGNGALSNIGGVEQRPLFYKWHKHKFFTLVYFMLAQLFLFVRLLRALQPGDIVYINTLLPMGAALAAWIRKCPVVYHIHEVSLRPAVLKKLLYLTAEFTATDVLFVSVYAAGQYRFKRPVVHVIHNSLPNAFIQATAGIPRLNLSHLFTATMLCSLKAYKGVYHMMRIARALPAINFELVLNATEKEVACFIKDTDPPANCHVFAAQDDTAAFYRRAHVVLNLSLPEGWIETFGMTLLEAMHCGRPVICPTVGGVLELVKDGVEGYSIDSNAVTAVCSTLESLSRDFKLYKEMSEAAVRRAALFTDTAFDAQLRHVFSSGHSVMGKNAALLSIKWK